MSLVVSAFFAFVNAGTHCATLYEHHRCNQPSECEHPDGGAQYNIIVGDLAETTNFRGGYSIDGYYQTSWWDDRVSGFKVQPNCKLELWCEADQWPTHHAPNYMGGWSWNSYSWTNLINSWNDCVSKFRCCCGPYCGGQGRRMEDKDGLQQRRDEILRELRGDRALPERQAAHEELLEKAMKKNPVLAELIQKAVELEGREESEGREEAAKDDFVLWEGPDGEISATRPDGVESDSSDHDE